MKPYTAANYCGVIINIDLNIFDDWRTLGNFYGSGLQCLIIINVRNLKLPLTTNFLTTNLSTNLISQLI